jgi:hypothetical protein
VILDVHRQAALFGIEGRPFGDRPRCENAARFEPEIVVQPARAVLLDDEAQFARLLARRTLGLGGIGEVPLADVLGERIVRAQALTSVRRCAAVPGRRRSQAPHPCSYTQAAAHLVEGFAEQRRKPDNARREYHSVI